MSRRIKKKPDEVRTAQPVDSGLVQRIHTRLGEISIILPRDPDAKQMREFFSMVRELRNSVSKVMAVIHPKIGSARADLVRVDRFIESFGSYMTDTGDGMALVKNESQRKARILMSLEEWFDAKAEIKVDLALLEEVVWHAKMVKDELKAAFEEASRSLSAIEFEFKVEKDA